MGGVSTSVHAEVSVGGAVLGQIAVGDKIVQFGSVHGDVVVQAPPSSRAELVLRHRP